VPDTAVERFVLGAYDATIAEQQDFHGDHFRRNQLGVRAFPLFDLDHAIRFADRSRTKTRKSERERSERFMDEEPLPSLEGQLVIPSHRFSAGLQLSYL
jgi:hypothetical protein